MARPTKYTPDVVKRLTDAISMGVPYELACKYAGISEETFSQWRKSKPEFSELVSLAEGGAVVKWMAKIEQAATDGTWQAAAWKAERRYPHFFGRTDRVEVTIRQQAEALAAELGVPVDEVIREAERIANRR